MKVSQFSARYATQYSELDVTRFQKINARFKPDRYVLEEMMDEITFSAFWCQEKYVNLLKEKFQQKMQVQNVKRTPLKNVEMKPGDKFNNHI